ncbi:Copper chaperone CopZ [termite gut metagenome]|jgi:Cu(I)/Ag(I) efflux system membrane fusion protein|uniref:Copper chaperone CopZ n=1 Tax=termite gut metagenome TaxID=433724 RepID=A0A5J4R4U7_9ZZZZ
MKKYFFVIAAGMFSIAMCNASSLRNQSNDVPKAETVNASMSEQPQSEHAMLSVQGSCGMCKTRIEKTAKGIKGVSSATWDMEKKELHVDFDSKQTNLNAISKAIAKAGHDTEKHKTDKKTYDALPGCCKYR